MKRTIEIINDKVEKATWDCLLSRFVSEQNRGFVKRTTKKSKEYKNRLWKELCEETMERLEKAYKDLFKELPGQSDIFRSYLKEGYPKGSENVGECFDTIEKLIKEENRRKKEAEEKTQQVEKQNLTQEKIKKREPEISAIKVINDIKVSNNPVDQSSNEQQTSEQPTSSPQSPFIPVKESKQPSKIPGQRRHCLY